VLFLHGYLSCKESFFYQIEFLADNGYRVTAPDILGFGRSAPLTVPYSVADYAAWVEKLMISCGLVKPHIIAHSFGGRVALKLLSENGGIADKLVLCGGAGLVKPRSPQYMRQVRRYRAVKKLFPGFAEKHFGSEEYRTLSPVMRESYKLIVNEDLRYCAAKIKNKTLLLYGSDDNVTPASEEGEIFNGLIKGSRLVVTKGGHFCFAEHPEVINGEIMRFFTE
jgi:pimeloyl-ACP methyl ester carboxylesterase